MAAMPAYGTALPLGFEFSDVQDVALLRFIIQCNAHRAEAGQKVKMFELVRALYVDDDVSIPIVGNKYPSAHTLLFRLIVLMRIRLRDADAMNDTEIQREKANLLDTIIEERKDAGIALPQIPRTVVKKEATACGSNEPPARVRRTNGSYDAPSERDDDSEFLRQLSQPQQPQSENIHERIAIADEHNEFRRLQLHSLTQVGLQHTQAQDEPYDVDAIQFVVDIEGGNTDEPQKHPKLQAMEREDEGSSHEGASNEPGDANEVFCAQRIANEIDEENHDDNDDVDDPNCLQAEDDNDVFVSGSRRGRKRRRPAKISSDELEDIETQSKLSRASKLTLSPNLTSQPLCKEETRRYLPMVQTAGKPVRAARHSAVAPPRMTVAHPLTPPQMRVTHPFTPSRRFGVRAGPTPHRVYPNSITNMNDRRAASDVPLADNAAIMGGVSGETHRIGRAGNGLHRLSDGNFRRSDGFSRQRMLSGKANSAAPSLDNVGSTGQDWQFLLSVVRRRIDLEERELDLVKRRVDLEERDMIERHQMERRQLELDFKERERAGAEKRIRFELERQRLVMQQKEKEGHIAARRDLDNAIQKVLGRWP